MKERKIIKILHVDDQENNLWLTRKKLLKEDPYLEITGALSYQEATSLLTENRFDLVLTDYNLAEEQNGLDILDFVQKTPDPIPVIFLTSQGNEQVAADAFRNGAVDYFTRQVDVAYFARLVNSIRRSVDRFREHKERSYFEKLFHRSLETTPTSVFIVNDRKEVIYWNKSCEALTGLSSEKVLKTSLYKDAFQGERNLEQVFDCILQRNWQGVPRECVQERYKGENPFYELEGYFSTRFAEQRYLRFSIAPLYGTNRQKEIEAIIITILDLTENKKTYEELAQKNDQLMKLLRYSPIPIYIHQDNHFKLFNNKLSELSGYSLEELENINIWHLVHPDDLEYLKNNALKRMTGEEIQENYRFKGITKDGKPLDLIGYFTLIQFAGKPAVLGQLYDLSVSRVTETPKPAGKKVDIHDLPDITCLF